MRPQGMDRNALLARLGCAGAEFFDPDVAVEPFGAFGLE